MNYCIRTKRHKDHHDKLPVWWGPNRTGYTVNPDKAGRYSKEEAELLCSDLHGKDYPVKEASMSRHRKNFMDILKRRMSVAFDGATVEQVERAVKNYIGIKKEWDTTQK